MFQVADGYIVLGPLCSMHFVTPITDFVTPANLENTLQQIRFFYQWHSISAKSANDSLAVWAAEDRKKFYDRLKVLDCR